MRKTRLLDMGQVSAVRSQTIYHAVAECAGENDPPTLSILRPNQPYVSIGYHQEAGKEVDLKYCQAHNLPVIRRMVGGGAVLLDENQLFFHIIVPRKKLPALGLPLRLAERYPLLARPAIAAYHKLGIPAAFRPINDIHVHGRKLGGTGAADIGEAFVFVGSMMLDFNHALMARVLRFSDEKMRDKVHKSMEEYVTSLKRETGDKPPLDTVREALLAGFREELQLEPEPGHLTPKEEQKIEELNQLFLSEGWLHRISWQDRGVRKLTISGPVRFFEAEHKVLGGLLRMAVRVVDGCIDDLLLSGDFSLSPGEAFDAIRRTFIGAPFTVTELDERIIKAWQTLSFDMPGITAEDFLTLARKLVGMANP